MEDTRQVPGCLQRNIRSTCLGLCDDSVVNVFLPTKDDRDVNRPVDMGCKGPSAPGRVFECHSRAEGCPYYRDRAGENYLTVYDAMRKLRRSASFTHC